MKRRIEIVSLSPENWREYKNLRLEALKEEPLAFGSSPDDEEKKDQILWEKELDRPKRKRWYFARDDGKLAGMAGIKFSRKRKFAHLAHLVGVYVNKGHRGKGIARKLMETAIKDTFSTGDIKKIRLLVNASQKPAVSLYKNVGFREVGKFKDEFSINGRYYDSLVMEIYNK